VRAGEARAAARHWVQQHAASDPAFRGAYLAGSVADRPAHEPQPPWSDVDVSVVIAGSEAPPKPGKIRHRGALVDVTYRPEVLFADPVRVAASHIHAPSFAGPPEQVLSDPTGLLGRLRAAIAPTFAEPEAVRRRCADVFTAVRSRLTAVDYEAPWPQQVMGWMFPTSLVTVAVLVAAGRRPTVRLRYREARDVLRAAGRLDLYEQTLELLGCVDRSPALVADHLDRLAGVFDDAAAVGRTPFFFSTDISAAARVIAIDGSRALVAAGDHREAVFWIIATLARCRQILAVDAPRERCRAGERALRAATGELLGVHDSDDLRARTAATLALLPTLEEATAALVRSSGKPRS
jgi:hypothetical protein